MSRAQRIAYFAAAPLLSLIAFRRVFSTWFLADDFGWMALRDQLQDRGLLYALFHPFAQGTVRVLSERIPFLVFPALFPLNPIPFRILAFTTWIAALTLAALIGERLTGSRAAGLIAAVFWGVNANLTQPLGWASSYNETLCAALILAAFYSRLRGWRLAEWAAFLAGLATLEIAVVYPALAALHALCFDRKRFRGTLPLFVPSAIFGALHAFYIPRTSGPDYAIAVGGHIFSNLFEYLKWTTGGPQLYQFTTEWRESGIAAAWILGLAFLGLWLWRAWRRDPLAPFSMGWFLLLLAPMLVLPNHHIDYAVTSPFVGFAWVAASAMVAGWRSGALARAGVVAFAALYLVPTWYETELYTEWRRDRSLRIRAVVEGVRAAHARHPDDVFLLQGIDRNTFDSGFDDDPFHLIGAKVYLTPGSSIPAQFDGMDRTHWMISPRGAYSMLEAGQARVLTLTGTSMRDTTPIYRAVLRVNPEVTRHDFVDVGDPAFASLLGPGWFEIDNRSRWMGKTASVRLSGPATAAQKLFVTGFAPPQLLVAGPVTLRFSANGAAIGTGVVKSSSELFSFSLPLPAALVGREQIEIGVEASRTYRPPGDGRDLGMVFGTFALR